MLKRIRVPRQLGYIPSPCRIFWVVRGRVAMRGGGAPPVESTSG